MILFQSGDFQIVNLYYARFIAQRNVHTRLRENHFHQIFS